MCHLLAVQYKVTNFETIYITPPKKKIKHIVFIYSCIQAQTHIYTHSSIINEKVIVFNGRTLERFSEGWLGGAGFFKKKKVEKDISPFQKKIKISK